MVGSMAKEKKDRILLNLIIPTHKMAKSHVRPVENPGAEVSSGIGRKVLVHTTTNEVITSYSDLERKLSPLGWERYYDDPNSSNSTKRSTVDLISLPKDFNKFKSMHMFDIVVKNRNIF
ncbi:hypothetical protein NL676_029924 [Syzygium grande]|nr:hypothetical protein NL676_029924 [Syzygium grande]